jgi:solute carrier family 25 protein 38
MASAVQTDVKSKLIPSNTQTQLHLYAGFLAGLTSSIVLQPLDLLKTRIQQSSTNRTLPSSLKEITSISSLWRGTLPSAARTSVGSALYFTMLNATRTRLACMSAETASSNGSSSLPKLSMQANLLSGAFVRGFVGFVTMPITVVKVRYESSLVQYNSIAHTVSSIYNVHGIKGFFYGYGVTFLRDAPYAGLYVLFYEHSKDLLNRLSAIKNHEQKMNTSTSALINWTSAVGAAAMSTMITGPFDTIKTRVQLDPVKYPSFITTIKIILQEGGVRNLFDGLSLRLARKAMSSGIAWCLYEELVKKRN